MDGGEEQVRSTLCVTQGCSSGPSDVSCRVCVQGHEGAPMHRLLSVHVSVCGRLLLHTRFSRHTNASLWACTDTSQHNNMGAGENALQGEA